MLIKLYNLCLELLAAPERDIGAWRRKSGAVVEVVGIIVVILCVDFGKEKVCLLYT
ncbi:MAG: hypothetical protein K2I25_04050 [Muribaculaceae bacterium]|nr:hypothetical protein [Muribaculaceae bacterium]